MKIIVPELNVKQLDRFSEFLANFSLLNLATLVLPNFLGTQKPDMLQFTTGMIEAVSSLILSLFLIRKRK